jgi:hypothetical protein
MLAASTLFGMMCFGFLMDWSSDPEDTTMTDEASYPEDEALQAPVGGGMWPWEEEFDAEEQVDYEEEQVQDLLDMPTMQDQMEQPEPVERMVMDDGDVVDEHSGRDGHDAYGDVGHSSDPVTAALRLSNDDDFHEGTAASEHIIGRQGNDTIFGNGGTDTLVGWAGEDTLISHGTGGHLSGNTFDDTLEARKTGYGQFHMHGGDGDDTLVMHQDNEYGWGHQGFHVYGDEGADRFMFVGEGNPDAPMVSRIDDFDASVDSIWVDDTELDLNNLPDDMRIIDYQGQQWLVINDASIVGLEGVRMDAPEGVPTLPDGNIELHFHAFPADLASLPSVPFRG